MCSPGVHFLRDYRTNVYNFDPFLRNITQPDEFNFDSVPKFIPPSEDAHLIATAARHSTRYVSSTSSISPTLSQLYFLISRLKGMNLSSRFTGNFDDEPQTFTQMSRAPIGMLLRPHHNVQKGVIIRSVVTEKTAPEDEKPNVLMQLGNVLEKLLTHSRQDFEHMLKGAYNPYQAKKSETYNYLLSSKFLLRSQLDCHDPRLPQKSFDLKTRATLPVRMDVHNYRNYLNYRLHRSHGLYESFEREFYDLCRSALLKYYFQVRIGDMDGIMIAYHNTAELFGFQYVTRAEMDEILFGNSATGDAVFRMVLQIYEEVLDVITPLYDEQGTIRITFSLNKDATKLTIFSESIGNDKESSPNNLYQFTLTSSNAINGFRAEELILSPTGLDDWRVDWQLQRQRPNPDEFELARRKVTLTDNARSSVDQTSTDPHVRIPLIKGARRVYPTSSFVEDRPEILALWTKI